MSLIHGTSVVHSGSMTLHPMSTWLFLGSLAAILLTVHTVRAIRVSTRTAERWMQARSLPLEPRLTSDVEAYLRRLRWGRVVSTAAFAVLAMVAVHVVGTPISFLSAPFLLSVVVAELLAPEPRRARVREAALTRRSRSYFAPPRILLLARIAIALAAAFAATGAVVGTHWPAGVAVVHAAAMVTGGIILEAGLAVLSQRALPDRWPDLAVDTAMRVNSARTAVAAALLFGTLGLFLSVGLSGVVHGPTGIWWSQLFNVALLGSLCTSVWLLQPLRSWRPRGTA